ncbi:hypothetical protein ABTY15_21470, partial [Kitasatospora sp. NPDC097643]
MTVLHSRNADAADPADVADAADVKDPQDAKATTAENDLREDLGRYAELGAFTLTADTHAWFAAVDTVATPEDARAASTALAELRGQDLQQTWEAVTALATEAKLDEPDTVAKTALLVELLQRVHRTSTSLTPAAYDADLAALAAATADSTWRREHGVKLSWLRARSLRKQATALAADRRIRREDLHEALTSAEIERRAWAALAPAGTIPVVPADGALVERTAQTFEAINTGLRGLARLLPEQDLDGLAFADLVELVERLAADEGTLYRLPTIRSLRAILEEAGLGDLLAELTAAQADRRAAEAAYTARQALAGGQRDGLAEAEPVAVEEPVAEVEVEATSEVGSVTEVEAEAEAAEVELTVAEETAEDVAEEAPAAVVTLPAPSPAADDLVAAATAALVEAAEVEAEAAEVETADDEVAEAAEVEAAQVDAPEVEVVAVAEVEVAETELVEAAAVDTEIEVVEAAEVEAVDVEVAEVEVATATEVEVAEVEVAEVEVAETEPVEAAAVDTETEVVEAAEAEAVEVEVAETEVAAVVAEAEAVEETPVLLEKPVEPVLEAEPAGEPELV